MQKTRVCGVNILNTDCSKFSMERRILYLVTLCMLSICQGMWMVTVLKHFQIEKGLINVSVIRGKQT